MVLYISTCMFRLNNILILVLAVSVVMAGFPVQAKPHCPSAAAMQMQQMDMKGMKDCKGCVKTSDRQDHQKKTGCCGDMECAAKCSSMSNAGTTFFGTQHGASISFASSAESLYGPDHKLASHLLNTQDRPPKYLS